MPDSFLEEQFAEPYQAWKADPTPRTRAGLLHAVDPVVRSALRSYAGSAASPALYGRAKVMTLQAVEKYDPSRAGLKTHLMTQLQGLRRHAQRAQNVLSIPERVRLDRQHLDSSFTELRDQLGRDPSDLELADKVGLSLKRIAHVRKAVPGYAESQLRDLGEEGESVTAAPAVRGGPEDDRAWLEFVYHSVQPLDQLILEHTMGMNGKAVLSNQDLARRLRVTPSAVSQRKAKLQGYLNERAGLEGF